MRGIAKWHVFIPNEAFLVAKSALGPCGAKPPHIHMTQEKISQFLTHYVECGVARARGNDLESTVFVGLAFENLVEVNKYVPCWVKFILRDPS